MTRNIRTLRVPDKAFSLLGDIPVDRTDLGGDFGLSEFQQRTITVAPNLDDTAALQTYFHECVHFALFDAGVQIGGELEESVCDALGTYLAAACRAGHLKVKA